MEKQWTMREYREGDEARIIEYLNRTLAPEKKRSLRYWQWEYKHNPTGITTIWVAEDGAILAGHYALMPLKFKVGHTTYLGAQSIDTFTHDDYRRLGIFVALANKVYALASDHGVAILYGFPSTAAYQGFVEKLGWIKVTSLDKLTKPVDVKSLVFLAAPLLRRLQFKALFDVIKGFAIGDFRRRKLLRGFTGATLRSVSRFNGAADELWRNLAAEKTVRVVKDSKYLNWRYIQKPGNRYAAFQISLAQSVLGYVVVETRPDRGRYLKKGLVLDIIGKTDRPHLTYLISASEHILRKLGCDTIAFWAPRGSRAHDIISSEGYVSRGELILIARQNRHEVREPAIRRPKDWFIMSGDTDVV